MPHHPLLDGLDPAQRAAAEHLHGPLCIVAGAGTGKTRTITHRVAHGVLTGDFAANKVLAVTHSAKAAGEMRHRLGVLGAGSVNARTFHSAAMAQLRFFWGATGHERPLVILDQRYPLVRSALERVLKRSASKEEVFDVSSEINWAKARLVAPSGYAAAAAKAHRALDLEPEQVAQAFRLYETLKESAGKLDFEDLLSETAALVENDTAVAEHVRATYTHFVVDEYQDVDPLQARLLDAWLGERDDICVVGDPRQSIYAFRGAEASLFKAFTDRFTDAKVVELTRDYRSTPQVVKAANTLVGSRQDSLVGQLEPGPEPEVHAFEDENSEERFVVERVKALLDSGVPAREIAVLYRFNSQSARFEAAFTKAGVPYLVSDNERFFERPEVKQVLAALWEAGRHQPDAVGLELLDDVLADLGHDRDLPPSGAGRARERWEAITALLGTIEELPGVESLAVRYLLEEMTHRVKESHSPTRNGVTLCTLHKAKGLEWEAVFMVSMTEGSLPSSYATTDAMVAEERRLAYVGVTRAKRVLHLTFARTSARGWSSKPSRFLAAFGFTTGKPAVRRARSRPARPRATHCRDCANPLSASMGAVGLCASCLPSVANDLADRLASWRRARAGKVRIPVEDVMTDDLLWRIVLARPTKLGALVVLDGFTESGAAAHGRAIVALCK